jgi:hypothetical protein
MEVSGMRQISIFSNKEKEAFMVSFSFSFSYYHYERG